MRAHLLPAFGHLRLEDVTIQRIEAHLAAARKAGLAPGTLHRQLSTLSLVLRSAKREGLIRDNPVPDVDRPKSDRRKWRILSPTEVGLVIRAFDALISEATTDRDRDDLNTVRSMFLVIVATGLRRGEALGLHWRSVTLAVEPTLKVEETWVRAARETPKSEAGERTIPLGPVAVSELFEHRGRSAFNGDDERVWANPRTGDPFPVKRHGELFRLALGHAGIEGRVRPFHDLRHSSITNGAAAGIKPEALMARAGHSDYATTRRYIDLSGVAFREEADLQEMRLFGGRTDVTPLTPA
jgi:integrase